MFQKNRKQTVAINNSAKKKVPKEKVLLIGT